MELTTTSEGTKYITKRQMEAMCPLNWRAIRKVTLMRQDSSLNMLTLNKREQSPLDLTMTYRIADLQGSSSSSFFDNGYLEMFPIPKNPICLKNPRPFYIQLTPFDLFVQYFALEINTNASMFSSMFSHYYAHNPIPCSVVIVSYQIPRAIVAWPWAGTQGQMQ